MWLLGSCLQFFRPVWSDDKWLVKHSAGKGDDASSRAIPNIQEQDSQETSDHAGVQDSQVHTKHSEDRAKQENPQVGMPHHGLHGPLLI